ncbi:MAG: hypothetical protein JWR60_889 [Polaromonas sp.]|nr:hypothetical protein [Polaromonas sp.]
MGNFGLIMSLVAILAVVAIFVFVRSKGPKKEVERQAPRVPPSGDKSDIDFEHPKPDLKLRDVEFGIKPKALPEKPRVEPAQTPSADREPRQMRPEPAPVEAPSRPAPVQREPVRAAPPPPVARTQPAPVQREPVRAEPPPVVARLQPAPVQREPVRAEPPPVVVKPQPAPVQREPVRAAPPPPVVRTQPVVVPPAPKQAPAVRLAPMIYVVDDSAVVRAKMLKMLTVAGYRVQSGNDGVMGLALMKAGLPDLLITDIEMPEMDGHALIAALHADAALQRVPVVAISGHDGVREQLTGFSNVVDAFKKPWDAPVLLAKLEELVGPGIRQ